MTDYHINIFFSEEHDGYVADIPDLDACSALGDTPQKALAEVIQAKDAWLEAARVAGRPIPHPRYRPAIYRRRRQSGETGLDAASTGDADGDVIVCTPGVCGGRARIARTRIPVWTLASLQDQGATEADLFEAFPALPQEALQAARTYRALHAAEIERDIQSQEEEP